MYTDNINKEGSYQFLVKAAYTDYPLIVAYYGFNVHVVNNCLSPTSVASNTVIPTQAYTVNDPAISVTFDAFTVNPPYCPLIMVYDCESETVPSPPSGLLSID